MHVDIEASCLSKDLVLKCCRSTHICMRPRVSECIVTEDWMCIQALQIDADEAEQEALQTLQFSEDQLMDLACTVQKFQEQIAQVLPDVTRKRCHDQI